MTNGVFNIVGHDQDRSRLVFKLVNTNTFGDCIQHSQVGWVGRLVARGGPLGAHHHLHPTTGGFLRVRNFGRGVVEGLVVVFSGGRGRHKKGHGASWIITCTQPQQALMCVLGPTGSSLTLPASVANQPAWR